MEVYYKGNILSNSLINSIEEKLDFLKNDKLYEDYKVNCIKLYDFLCQNSRRFNNYFSINYKNIYFINFEGSGQIILNDEKMKYGSFYMMMELYIYYIILAISIILIIIFFIDIIFITKRKYDISLKYII